MGLNKGKVFYSDEHQTLCLVLWMHAPHFKVWWFVLLLSVTIISNFNPFDKYHTFWVYLNAHWSRWWETSLDAWVFRLKIYFLRFLKNFLESLSSFFIFSNFDTVSFDLSCIPRFNLLLCLELVIKYSLLPEFPNKAF